MLSIVIPTLNREMTLRATVAALQRTTAPTSAWEIIVVDDSADEKPGLERLGNFSMIYTARKRPSDRLFTAAHARNVGLRAARGDVVAFMDDDILHLTDPISATLDHFTAHAGVAVCAGGLWFVRDLGSNGANGHALEGPHTCTGARPCAHWLAVERSVLMSMGGYDERFIEYGGEDTDLVARLDRLGIRFHWHPGIVAVHLLTAPPPAHRCRTPQFEAQRRIIREDTSIVRNQSGATPCA